MIKKSKLRSECSVTPVFREFNRGSNLRRNIYWAGKNKQISASYHTFVQMPALPGGATKVWLFICQNAIVKTFRTVVKQKNVRGHLKSTTELSRSTKPP